MKRRGFLGLLAGAAVAPFVPTPKVQPHTVGSLGAPPLMFHKDAFALTFPPLRVGEVLTVKLPQRYERLDVLYGCQTPTLGCRIEG